ncbi:MAG: CDP-diacylglycerol--serine O-phosphatidyltransferase, partial [Burkholderia sp.]|nr:CDP-diacylglycerol--serine O-phosphatidyltransferase [Burkholderia sp.]
MAAFKPRRPRNGSGQTPRPFRRNKGMVPDQAPLESRRAARQRFLKTRGIYLLPNAFTTAALFCGFFAVVQAMNVRFEIAAIA